MPDYEEAFRWFSIGSAGGNNESTYKLGDLFFDGYGVQKNPKIALRLYKDVYWRTLEQLLYGTDTSNFADAAWRLGDCYRYGRGCDADPEKAYMYYLQAKMALQRRMKADKRIGDDEVMDQLQKKIKSMRKIYTAHETIMRMEYPYWLKWAINPDRQGCVLNWNKAEDGSLSLVCRRLPGSKFGYSNIVATFPAGDYCELVKQITVTTEKDVSMKVQPGAEEVIFDDFLYDEQCQRVVLIRTGTKVAEIQTSAYLFRPDMGN